MSVSSFQDEVTESFSKTVFSKDQGSLTTQAATIWVQFRSTDILYITLFYELGIALLEYLCQWTILTKKNNLQK